MDSKYSLNEKVSKYLDGEKNNVRYIKKIDSKKYIELKEALEKLKLNDASLSFEPETSKALGFGFRCGFLGMLHMDVIEERIEREFNIDLIATSPSVIYEVTLTDGNVVLVENPTKLPDRTVIKEIKEPYKGRYGRGYVIKRNNPRSNMFYLKDYYIRQVVER